MLDSTTHLAIILSNMSSNLENNGLTIVPVDASVTTNPLLEDPVFDNLHVLTPYEIAMWFFLYGVVAFLAVAGNLLVIYVVATSPRLQSVTSYFIVNLSVADAMTGLLAVPFKFQVEFFVYFMIILFFKLFYVLQIFRIFLIRKVEQIAKF